MKIKLDRQLNRKLRDKINGLENFSFNKTSEFKFPSDPRGIKRKGNAFNCICAALDRIDDLVEHCNELDLIQTKEGTFALCDLFNYGQTLIDCITIIGNIYGVKYNSSNDTSSFHQEGKDGKGNDEKYFKYLRSLCSVHPLGTNSHSEYQGDQPEWCPYINTGKSISGRWISIHDETFKDADFIASVYRNDSEFSKYIPIHTKQIFNYIKKRYKFINKIIKGIDNYNNTQIQYLKNKQISLPSEFATYDDYLKNLEKEIQIRVGRWEYQARIWRAVFKTHFDDELYEDALFAYQSALKSGISKVHNKLQAMDFFDEDWTCDAIEDRNIEALEDYYYELEKLVYLFPSYAVEDKINEDFSFINEPINVDCLRMKEMLDIIDTAIKSGANHEELKMYGRFLDGQYKVSNSEWARIQLKIMSPVLGKYITFNYYTNDWHLYLQTEIAKWLLLQDKEL